MDRNFSDVLKTIVQSFFKYNQPYKWHVSAKFHDRCYPHGVNDNDLVAIKRETLSFPATIQFGVLKYTSNSFLSFSTSDFMDLTFLRIVKAWMYSWFWNGFLDFVWGLPAAIMITLKLLVNAALGAWLLPVAKKLNSL